MCHFEQWLGMCVCGKACPPVHLSSPWEKHTLASLLSEEDGRYTEQTWTHLQPGVQPRSVNSSQQANAWVRIKKKTKNTKNCFWSHWVWLIYCAVWQWQQISDQKAISTSWTQTGKTNLIAYPLNSITRQRRIIYNNSRTQTLTTNSWKDIS